MAEKRKPQRMCIACRRMCDKGELLRLIKNDGGISLDKTGRAAGRGAYLCRDIECFDKAVKNRSFEKTFGVKSDWTALREEFKSIVDERP